MTEAALEPAGAGERYARPLFFATIVTGSFLLFLTQPMVARMALPRLGGAPAVWNSAMLVYQALLLGGYAYAHWLSQLAPRRQAGLHLALFAVAALWLPIGLGGAVPAAGSNPALWVPWFLTSSIGPLFFVIAAQAPLMQRWYSLETARGEPYALYAASNLGSFGGLISYPLIVEPLLTLEQQSYLWTGGYALLVLLVVGCALTIPSVAVEEKVERVSPRPGLRRILTWIALAAVPSGLMLSTTTHLTTDIVAMPLIWVVPLGLYLLSFVVAFAARRGPTIFLTQIAPLIILIAGGLAFAQGSQRPVFSATLGLSLLFIVAVALHGEMYRLRPQADRLTGFYLAMSIGGVLGGIFCALLAPAIFDWAYEHPLLVLAAALLLPQRNYLQRIERIWKTRRRRLILGILLPVAALALSVVGDPYLIPWLRDWTRVAACGLIAMMALFSIGRPLIFALCLGALMMSYGGWTNLSVSSSGARTRSYFGVYTVTDSRGGKLRMLTHGTTLHGVQNRGGPLEEVPTSYYVSKSGVGLAMTAAEQLYGPGADIGVIGLGTGTLACYAVPGQSWTFFEIDPKVVSIARDSGWFSYLRRCTPEARIVLGDARLTMARQAPASLDLVAVDAFSSDAVPMHLLTREALQVYGRALRPDGLLLMHISNRYLDLEPVLASGSKEGGWSSAIVRYSPDDENKPDHPNPSSWVAMSRNPEALKRMMGASGAPKVWRGLKERPGFSGWTDDYATILPLLQNFTK